MISPVNDVRNQGFDYIVGSRRGLYLVNHTRWVRIADGYFFGVTIHDSDIYCFKTVSAKEAVINVNPGRIVRYRYLNGVWSGPETLVDGLDHNCHQMAFFSGYFYLVDTGNQRILAFDAQWNCARIHPIGPPVARHGPEDAHINSFLGCGDRIYLMFHNGSRACPSEIVEFDLHFHELGRTTLRTYGCHDIERLEDGRMLYCDSFKGEIALDDGTTFKIDELFTRGLAVGPHEIAVGSSWFGGAAARGLLPGFVTFLDRAFNRIARLYLPAAPTQIRRLSDVDLSRSQPH